MSGLRLQCLWAVVRKLCLDILDAVIIAVIAVSIVAVVVGMLV